MFDSILPSLLLLYQQRSFSLGAESVVGFPLLESITQKTADAETEENNGRSAGGLACVCV